MNEVEFNDNLEEIKDYLKNHHVGYDKQEIIVNEIEGKLDCLNGYSLDEMGIEWDSEYITDLDSYTNDVFDILMNLACNVIDSFKK